MPRWGGKASLGTLFSSLGQNLVALSIVLPSIPEFPNRSLPTTSQFLINSQLRKVLFTNLTWVIQFGNWKITVTSDLGWWKIRWKRKKSHQRLFGTCFLLRPPEGLLHALKRWCWCLDLDAASETPRMVYLWFRDFREDRAPVGDEVNQFTNCVPNWIPNHDQFCGELRLTSVSSPVSAVGIGRSQVRHFGGFIWTSGPKNTSGENHLWCDPYPFSHSQVLWLWYSI